MNRNLRWKHPKVHHLGPCSGSGMAADLCVKLMPHKKPAAAMFDVQGCLSLSCQANPSAKVVSEAFHLFWSQPQNSRSLQK